MSDLRRPASEAAERTASHDGGGAGSSLGVESALSEFIARHERVMPPLASAAALAAWKASISGDPADYEAQKQAQLAVETAYADRDDFALLQAWRAAGVVHAPHLHRQLDLLWLAFLGRQVPAALLERTIAVQSDIDRTFSTFRSQVGGRACTDNDLRELLRSADDSATLRAAWEASKQVGVAVQPQLLEVVRLRNEAAQALGAADFFHLQMQQQEFDVDSLGRLFDALDVLTRDAFVAAKADVDTRLARRYRVDAADLRPWHYHNPFFQEAPAVFAIDLDAVYARSDVVDVTRRYFASVGFDIDPILRRSDLFEKDGKNPHAYCTHIDRAGDVRVFANVRADEYWMGTMLHEVGHAVYDQDLGADLPWLLRTPAHTLTTEAIAMLFGRLSKNAAWMQAWAGLAPERRAAVEAECGRMLAFEQLLFSRWVQVVMRFERAMYADPQQDLNTLWWDLVERYQQLHRPEQRDAPDWAAKYHIAMAPVYYHNYMLGELMASQLHAALAAHVAPDVDPWIVTYGHTPAVGAWLRERVFEPGASLGWNDLVRHATGAPLGATAFAAQFVAAAG